MSRYYNVEKKDREGKPVFIAASGPSIKKVNRRLLKDEFIITVNNTWELFPWAQYLVFKDFQWWEWHGKKVEKEYNGTIVNVSERYLGHERLKIMRHDGKYGLSTKPDTLSGTDTGHTAINLGYLLGFREIILLGFDMRVVDGKHHWHEDHPVPTRDIIYNNVFIPRIGTLVEPLEREGVRVLNATKGSALPYWPFVSLNSILV